MHERIREIIQRAKRDPHFQQRLRLDPKQVLREEGFFGEKLDQALETYLSLRSAATTA